MANESKHMIHSLGGSKSFGALSLRAKVLWPMLIANCDDQGRFDANAQCIKWNVCQNVSEIGVPDVPELLSEMATQGMLVLYGNDNQWGQVVNWWPHQPMAYARPSKFPAPEGWTDRIRYRKGSETWIKEGWDSLGGFPEGYEPKIQEGKRNEGTLQERYRNVSSNGDKEPALVKHWAVQCYRHVVHKHVKIPLREGWVAFTERNYTDPDEDANFQSLKADIKAFMAKGWYEGNIEWLMKWVESGKPEKWANGKSKGEPQLTPEERAIYFPDA